MYSLQCIDKNMQASLLNNLHKTHFVRRARVQNTTNICMQAMRIRWLWLDGDPPAIDMLDVYVLLRVGREPELSNISAHPVYVVHGKNQIKIIFGFVACLAKLDANIRATGADSPKEQRMPNDWPVR